MPNSPQHRNVDTEEEHEPIRYVNDDAPLPQGSRTQRVSPFFQKAVIVLLIAAVVVMAILLARL